jgi:hypothetical protein
MKYYSLVFRLQLSPGLMQHGQARKQEAYTAIKPDATWCPRGHMCQGGKWLTKCQQGVPCGPSAQDADMRFSSLLYFSGGVNTS